jgi:hypothetical protein
MSDLKELLLKPRTPEGEVEVPGVGTVRVRGLSRAEFVQLPSGGTDAGEAEIWTLAHGLVDPKLTEAEVREWHAAAAAIGEIEPVVNMILELSNARASARREAEQSFLRQQGEERPPVRVPAGEPPEDDGGGTAGTDESG